MISFVWDTNMAAMSIVFCVFWDCVKTKNMFVVQQMLPQMPFSGIDFWASGIEWQILTIANFRDLEFLAT